jgi:hypothetical protein
MLLQWSTKRKGYNNEVCDRRYRTLPVDGKDELLGRQKAKAPKPQKSLTVVCWHQKSVTKCAKAITPLYVHTPYTEASIQ